MNMLLPIRSLALIALSLSLGATITRGFYNPTHGRWLCRDPIEENGGRNLYGFTESDSINRTDRLGLIVDGLEGQEIALIDAYFKCGCRCVSVDVRYDPGGDTMQLNWYGGATPRFGTKIRVRWKVVGNPAKCKYYQDETGTIVILT